MIVDVSSLGKGVSCVYKITYPNNKVYIGYSKDLRRRMWEHNNMNKNKTFNDTAIVEFGKVKKVELLYLSDDIDDLEKHEAFWIEKYDSTNIENGYNVSSYGGACGKKGENSSKSKLTNDDVVLIRERKMSGEKKKNVYDDYSNKISLGGFEHIWWGTSYDYVLPEIINHFEKYTKSEKISLANTGIENGRAKLTEDDVLNIREMYDNKLTVKEINNMYSYISYSQINRICKRETWKHI